MASCIYSAEDTDLTTTVPLVFLSLLSTNLAPVSHCLALVHTKKECFKKQYVCASDYFKNLFFSDEKTMQGQTKSYLREAMTSFPFS